MTQYEFSLQQEVLMEKGASVLAEIFHYSTDHNIEDSADPINILYEQTWNAKQDILSSKTMSELERINGKFDLASSIVTKLSGNEPDNCYE